MDQKMALNEISFKKKVIASICYGLSGLILMFMNKIVLTTYRYPYYSTMALMQALSISITLFTLKKLKIVSFPSFSIKLIRQLFPIPIFYLVNLLTGLGATKYISVPMFVALRRFSIPLTIVLQYYILKIKTSSPALFAIFLLVIGSLIAVLQDFQFNFLGYFLCLINDVGDSCEAIFTKRQLNLKNQRDISRKYRRMTESQSDFPDFNDNLNESNRNSAEKNSVALNGGIVPKKSSDDDIDQKYDKNRKDYGKKNDDEINYDEINLGKVGIIYYCALLNILPLVLVVCFSGDLQGAIEFESWNDWVFPLMFVSCSFFSLVFLLTWITCTDFNSPLLSQIVAVMRSILSTYIGMYVGGDYIFNITNFFGLNLSLFGAFLYTYFNFSYEHSKEQTQKEDDNKKEIGSKEEKKSFVV